MCGGRELNDIAMHIPDEIHTDSTEHIAIRLRKVRQKVTRPAVFLLAVVIIYKTLGVPACRLDYKYTGSGDYKNIVWAKCITLKGFQEFNGHVPQFFFVKDGRITFPQG